MIKEILQFSLAKGVGDVTIKKCLYYIGKFNISYDSIITPHFLQQINIKPEIVDNILLCDERAKYLESKLIENKIKVITEISPKYPNYLKETLQEKCPPLLFVKGNTELLNTISVGFCGSRKVSLKGMSIADNCAKQLVEKNNTIISGYASGTDLTAHKSALINGGNTIFVLAEGILRAKTKKQIRDLLNNENHLFVSQFLPEIIWNAGNAMKRNSIIIGLSHAMILVESKTHGGTFAAGEEALRVNCPLFVIDFAKPEVSAEANPYFISKGGIPIRGKNGIPKLNKLFKIIDESVRIKNIQTSMSEQLIFNL